MLPLAQPFSPPTHVRSSKPYVPKAVGPTRFRMQNAPLYKRQFYHLGLEQFLAHLDVHVVADLGKLRLHISHADTYLKAGRHCTRRHDADFIPLGIGDIVAVARYTPVYHLEAYQLAGNPFSFLLLHERTVDEILALDELGYPSQTGFDRGRRIVYIVSVETETFLQTERVACPEADILETVLLAGFPECLPKLVGILIGDVYLAAARTGITRRGEDP